MVKAAEKKQEPINVEAMINDLAQKGNEALKVLSSFDQKKWTESFTKWRWLH